MAEPLNASFLPADLYEQAVLPFVERARGEREDFSLLELGSWNGVHLRNAAAPPRSRATAVCAPCPRASAHAGLYGLELASRFPRSTVVALEPNRTLWMQHMKLARALRRPNLACLHNPLTEEVAEALAHSNEFLDAQLVLSLHTARSFDHGVNVKDKMVRGHRPCDSGHASHIAAVRA